MRPVGIGETLRRALEKLAMRVAGDQAKTACGNLQLCRVIEAIIEGETQAVGDMRRERYQMRRGGVIETRRKVYNNRRQEEEY